MALYLDARPDADKAAAAAAEAAVAARARGLRAAGARILVAACFGSDGEGCGAQDVRFAPMLRVYVSDDDAAGQSLLDEPLVDARDAAIAASALERTLSALAGPSDAVAVDGDDETSYDEPVEP